MIENRRSVLLLIDLQRAFCDSDGSMAVQGRPINAMSEAARQCQALTQIARRRGRPVIWTRMMFAPDYSDGGMLTRLRPGLPKIGALRRGEPDVELTYKAWSLVPGTTSPFIRFAENMNRPDRVSSVAENPAVQLLSG